MNYSTEEKDFYQDISAQFSKAYPSIRLKIVTVSNTKYYSLLPKLFEEGKFPDIFTYHSSGNWVLSMSELLDKGWISSVSDDPDYIKNWTKRWPEASFTEGINLKDGSLFGFPYTDNNVRGLGYLYVNKKLLSSTGSYDYTNPETWKSFLEACRIVKQKTGKYPLVIPNSKPSDIKSIWAALSASIMTDQFFDYQKGRFCIDDPRLLKVFNFIATLYKEELVMPGPCSKIESREKFARGESVFLFDGSWLPNVIKKNLGIHDADLKVVRPPYPENGPQGTLAVRNTENKIWISSQTKHLAEARTFINWMTDPDGYYAREYLLRGFGKLAFIDAGKHFAELDSLTKQIFKVAEVTRVHYPEPMIACPEIMNSKAYRVADNMNVDGELNCIYNALFKGGEFSATAKKIAAEKNALFLKLLSEENASGIMVSKDCYTFPGLNFNADYRN